VVAALSGLHLGVLFRGVRRGGHAAREGDVRAGNRAEADDAGDADVADVTRRTRRDTAVENRQPLTEEDDEPGEDECGQRADRGAERPPASAVMRRRRNCSTSIPITGI